MTIKTLPVIPTDAAFTGSLTISGGDLGIAASGTVVNVSMPAANTEYSYTLPNGTKSYEIKARGSSTLKLAFAAGQSGIQFVEIPPGSSYPKDQLNTMGLTLYFQSPTPSEVAQVIVYS